MLDGFTFGDGESFIPGVDRWIKFYPIQPRNCDDSTVAKHIAFELEMGNETRYWIIREPKLNSQ